MIVADTYTRPQIALHWVIVGLVAAQFLTADAMEAFFDKAEKAGALAGFPTNTVAIAHAVGGSAILILMLVRLGVRLAYGAPRPPQKLTPVLQLASRIAHYGSMSFSWRCPPPASYRSTSTRALAMLTCCSRPL